MGVCMIFNKRHDIRRFKILRSQNINFYTINCPLESPLEDIPKQDKRVRIAWNGNENLEIDFIILPMGCTGYLGSIVSIPWII